MIDGLNTIQFGTCVLESQPRIESRREAVEVGVAALALVTLLPRPLDSLPCLVVPLDEFLVVGRSDCGAFEISRRLADIAGESIDGARRPAGCEQGFTLFAEHPLDRLEAGQ